MSAAWLTRSLGEVVAITKGRKPPRLIADSSGDSLPYATADYFRSGIATQFVPSADLASCVLTKKGCPVLIWDGSNAGEVFVGKDAVLASTMALIRPDDSVLDEGFCYFFLKTAFDKLNDGTTGSTIPHVSKHMLTALQIPILPLSEQRLISSLLFKLESAIGIQVHLANTTAELKRAAMRELFTRGLRGEPQKETEIGPVPESWEVTSLETVAQVRGGTSFPPALQGRGQGDLPFYKVSDMNLPGNEVEMRSATNWIDRGVLDQLRARPFPNETIIFPKVGGALHTNKKRLLTSDALVDNNIMGVTVLDDVPCHPKYLFGWFQTINLSSIANAGPLPSINSSRLYELKLPLPDLDEQREIVAILDAIDRKIDLHRRKKQVLEELFKALLHKLMTGEIRVDALDLSALQVHAGPVSPAAELAV